MNTGNAGSLIRIKRCSDGKKLSVSRFDEEEIQEMTSSKDVESRTLDVLVLSEPTRDLRKHVPKFLLPCPRTKEEQMYGQKLLTTNERYFDILFTLLESENTSVIDMAWKLLMKLPMNPKLKSRIASLHEKQDVNWKQLLDPNAMLKLLYSLQVVEKMLMKDGWSKHFRRLGGVKYLEVLILEIDVVKYVGGNLGARCVALLLKIMSYVYVVPTNSCILLQHAHSQQNHSNMNTGTQKMSRTERTRLVLFVVCLICFEHVFSSTNAFDLPYEEEPQETARGR